MDQRLGDHAPRFYRVTSVNAWGEGCKPSELQSSKLLVPGSGRRRQNSWIREAWAGTKNEYRKMVGAISSHHFLCDGLKVR